MYPGDGARQRPQGSLVSLQKTLTLFARLLPSDVVCRRFWGFNFYEFGATGAFSPWHNSSPHRCSSPKRALVTLISNQACSTPRQEIFPEPCSRNSNHSLWSSRNCLARSSFKEVTGTSKVGVMLTGSQDASKKRMSQKQKLVVVVGADKLSGGEGVGACHPSWGLESVSGAHGVGEENHCLKWTLTSTCARPHTKCVSEWKERCCYKRLEVEPSVD